MYELTLILTGSILGYFIGSTKRIPLKSLVNKRASTAVTAEERELLLK
ncbi:hypothetical protein [Desulfuribacillus stibiiarsenatis]|nr:hypothetical protein [Desulfuribacillus stibiiarsenatis]